jgi:superfamily II DNA/RNA helicase
VATAALFDQACSNPLEGPRRGLRKPDQVNSAVLPQRPTCSELNALIAPVRRWLVVIAPTRRLALQVKRELEWLCTRKLAQSSHRLLAAWTAYATNADAHGRGAYRCLTRLRDHIMRKSIDLST